MPLQLPATSPHFDHDHTRRARQHTAARRGCACCWAVHYATRGGKERSADLSVLQATPQGAMRLNLLHKRQAVSRASCVSSGQRIAAQNARLTFCRPSQASGRRASRTLSR
eukprot:816650-Rhodomonas_salina.1